MVWNAEVRALMMRSEHVEMELNARKRGKDLDVFEPSGKRPGGGD